MGQIIHSLTGDFRIDGRWFFFAFLAATRIATTPSSFPNPAAKFEGVQLDSNDPFKRHHQSSSFEDRIRYLFSAIKTARASEAGNSYMFTATVLAAISSLRAIPSYWSDVPRLDIAQ